MLIKLVSLLVPIRVMTKNKVFWICLLGLWYIPTIAALKITSLDVPKTAWDAVKLNCKYDLEGETLYSVKWYKDGVEFLRCLADGSVHQFPMKTISVYTTGTSQTGSCFFELTAHSTESGGEYTCEVSLDWPTFQTVSSFARLEAVEPSRNVRVEVVEHATTENADTIIINASKGPRCLYERINIILMIYVIYIFI